MEKLFDLNEKGCSIRCRLYAPDRARQLPQLVLYGHGFGGHKDNRAAARFADYLLAKRHDAGLVCFDWPCHGGDGRKKLLLEDCSLYLELLVRALPKLFGSEALYGYATSFGAYLFLKYAAEHGSPFRRMALRCPAVPMADVLEKNIMGEEERRLLARGKDALVGFDRKIRISPEFLAAVRAADLRGMDFSSCRDELLLLHGTKDEIVPFEAVERFAEEQRLLLLPVEKADHRFQDPLLMGEAVREIYDFFWG